MNPKHDKPGRLIPADIYPVNHGQPATPRPYTNGGQPPAAPDSPPDAPGGWRSAVPTILLFLLAPAIALCIAAFVIQSYEVDGESMEPTLQNNDRLVVDKIPRTISRITGHAYTPHRGDIIIFNQNGLPDSGPSGEKQLIKRVIGLPGEHLVVSGGKITIYNSAHPKGFNPDTAGIYHIAATTTIGNVDVQLSSNELFVCGDNRGNSEDSRYFGPIQEDQIVAKLVLRIMPLSKAERF